MSATATLEAPASVTAAPVPKAAQQTETKHRFTLEEYFALEAASEIRYEYDEGELIPMPGTSFEHNQIAGNFYRVFDRAFEDNDCRVFIEAIRFRISPNKYRYPDVMALCTEPISDGRKPPALLNPNVVIEVLSSSTENRDKGKKIEEYLQCDTVTDYLLVSQDKISVAHWSKNSAREWVRKEYVELSDTITLASIGVTITLAEIYRKIKFDSVQSTES